MQNTIQTRSPYYSSLGTVLLNLVELASPAIQNLNEADKKALNRQIAETLQFTAVKQNMLISLVCELDTLLQDKKRIIADDIADYVNYAAADNAAISAELSALIDCA
ncbi:MAG: hypothetical protein Q4E16_03385 [Neisseria sp.]|nr:hypothetical protein [Neisseria sp.]